MYFIQRICEIINKIIEFINGVKQWFKEVKIEVEKERLKKWDP